MNSRELITAFDIVDGKSRYTIDAQGHQTFGRASKKGTPDICVASGCVSRAHGEFQTDDLGCRYRDTGSLNGTYYNGRLLRHGEVVVLAEGDELKIHGPEDELGVMDVSIRPRCGEHVSILAPLQSANTPEYKPANRPELKDADLQIDIRARTIFIDKKSKTLLKDIYMGIPSNTMSIILGGSGAGKTTFMNAVMGYEQADARILYKGRDVYEEYDELKYEIGFVPQQDILRMSDTVWDTLSNAALMKLPVSIPKHQVMERVDNVLKTMGLTAERDSLVKKLSGGQRKRLSIAVEYIGNPALFFLDEPDSGLDGAMVTSLASSLRHIADEGKIVILISHSPDRIRDMIDNVIVLSKAGPDECGRLVFYGSVKDCLDFFETDALEKVVAKINRIEEGGEGKADYFLDKYLRTCR